MSARTVLFDAHGVVKNVILAGPDYAPAEGLTIGPPGGNIGDTWDGSAYIPPPQPEPPPTQDDYSAAIQYRIDVTARERGYADGYALASYVPSSIPAWAAEALSFVAWRDAVWIYAFTELAKVQAGQRPQPTIADLIAELPAIQWPDP